jgi:hypothetical protein
MRDRFRVSVVIVLFDCPQEFSLHKTEVAHVLIGAIGDRGNGSPDMHVCWAYTLQQREQL